MLQACLAFLKKRPPNEQTRLLKHFSPPEQNRIRSLTATFHDLSEGIAPPSDIIDRCHVSHLASLFRSLAESEVRLFLGALNPDQAILLKNCLLYSGKIEELTDLARNFIRTQIYDTLGGEAILPIEALPSFPLNPLILLSCDELLRLVSFLGLYDLSAAMKKIIATKKLKQIETSLAEDEFCFLKKTLPLMELPGFKKMSLDKWDGSSTTLRDLIHQRGINRLAKAIAGQDESYTWHLTHLLDTEDAKLCQQWLVPLESPKASQILITQVADLISFLYPGVLKQ